MNAQIVSTTIDVIRAGAYQHFEMRIPANTKKIVGVECGCRLLSDVENNTRIDTASNNTDRTEIGELRLHCANEHQWFYAYLLSDYVFNQTKTTHFLDSKNMHKPFMYHGKHEADTCHVIPNTTRIKGYFKDILGSQFNQAIQYQITISIHLETN